MFYGQQVQDTRQLFFESWKKYCQKESLTPLEQQIANVILQHPEYHALFNQESTLQQAYFPEMGQENPFLHMGLHLAIRDQVNMDKPVGIQSIYHQLLTRHQDALHVEHLMMDCLAQCLWQAQRNNQPPNENHFLTSCQNLVRS